MPTQLLPLTGGMVTNVPAYSLRGKSRLVVNLMVDEAGNNVSRPGMSSFCTPVAAATFAVQFGTSGGFTGSNAPPFVGLFEYGEWLVGVNENRRVFAIDEDGVARDITGDVLEGDSPPTALIDDDGSLILAGGGRPLRWDGGSLTKHEVSSVSGEMPLPTHLAVVNKYLIANNVGNDTINWTLTTDHRAWDKGTRYLDAESRNDPVTAMLAIDQMLYLFGPLSIDVYYPTRSTDPTFARSHTIEYGLAGPRAVIAVDQQVYFMDNRRRICHLVERRPQVISFEIENTLKELERVDDCVAFRIDIDGKHLIVWHFPTAAKTFVYEYALSTPGNSVWTEWREHTSGVDGAMATRAHCHHVAWGRHFVASATDGAILELSMDVGTDRGNRLVRSRSVGFMDAGTTHTKRCKALRCIMTRGTTEEWDEDEDGGSPVLEFRYRNEDMAWTSWVPISLGQRGHRNILGGEVYVGLGSYRLREWEFRTSEPIVRWSLARVEEEFDVMVR